MDAGEDGWERTWGPASLKEEERRRQIRESGRSFSTDDFFLTVCVLSICR